MGDKTGAYADHLASTTNAGSIHRRHNSWGRTRSPKSLVHENGTALTISSNTNTMKGTSASEVGYLTENQSFLHVLIEETNSGSNTNTAAVKAFGYCHAFQRWFELQQSQTGGYGTNSAATAASVDPPNSSTTPENHVPSAREFRVYELFGIDRVHFVCTTPARVRVFAAACTF